MSQQLYVSTRTTELLLYLTFPLKACAGSILSWQVSKDRNPAYCNNNNHHHHHNNGGLCKARNVWQKSLLFHIQNPPLPAVQQGDWLIGRKGCEKHTVQEMDSKFPENNSPARQSARREVGEDTSNLSRSTTKNDSDVSCQAARWQEQNFAGVGGIELSRANSEMIQAGKGHLLDVPN